MIYFSRTKTFAPLAANCDAVTSPPIPEPTIIASNFGGNYELLGNNDFGFTSSSLDIETVTNTIYTAIKDNSDLTTKSKELVNKHYNIENKINKFCFVIPSSRLIS